MTRYIFITGGVVSSLGKGLATAALGALLQARGYKIRLRKLDPYLNVDPGTMTPFEHGEVFVTDDGAETDLDLGHYERFTGIPANRHDNITTGQIYWDVINQERQGAYLGKTVQVIPHVINKIMAFFRTDITDEDFVICEIGGTVGDIEGLPFLEAIRQFSNVHGMENTLSIHVTLLPFLEKVGEIKTKPTQHSVQTLQSFGIRPVILLCRSGQPVSESIKQKIALFCNVSAERVIGAPDVDNIYTIPIRYHEEGFDREVMRYFQLRDESPPDLSLWHSIVKQLRSLKDQVKVAIVGKYTDYQDSYKSLIEALIHGGLANNVRVNLHWYESSNLENESDITSLDGVDAILIPGGFGKRGTEGMMRAVQFARMKNVPFFGVCFGMQIAVIDAARNMAGMTNADSAEFGPTDQPVIALIERWYTEQSIEQRTEHHNKGGTMRLGAFDTILREGTLIHSIYGKPVIRERHRHRYNINGIVVDQLEKAGLICSGHSVPDSLPEVIELSDHPWFVGVQYHPELQSRPFAPHPLFKDFIRAAVAYHNSGSEVH